MLPLNIFSTLSTSQSSNHIANVDHPRYENLKKNIGLEMKMTLDFLGLNFDKDVESCVMQNQGGSFKRPNSGVDFKQFFTNTQRENVEKAKSQLYTKLGFT